MIFETHTLNQTLKPHLESIFYYKDFMPDHSIERVVPTGHIFLIFELDGFKRSTFDNETLRPNKTYTEVWVSGMHKNYISISAHQKSEMLVVQFKPEGAYPFFHAPIEELNEKILHAKAVFGEEIIALRAAVINQESIQAKFAIVEEWLLSKLQVEKVPPSELLAVLERLKSNPVADLSQLIENYPKTQKHLINQFKKYFGLTPKYFQRILRFNEILQRINQAEKIEWSQVAYACEYSDQSHFIKEFKHFSGINPQKFIEQEFHKTAPNFFPLDREG